jgi:hypothetical protein
MAYDRLTSRFECLAVDTAGVPQPGVHQDASLSADGQLVVFVSSSRSLDSRCDAGGPTFHVFLRNRRTRRTDCLSLNPAGAQANQRSFSPVISALGNLIVFVSNASNLVAGDSNGAPDLFAIRLRNGVPEGPIERLNLGDRSVTNPIALDASGRFVVFPSQRFDLPQGLNARPQYELVRYDLISGEMVTVSASRSGVPGNGGSRQPSISPDGRFVAFSSNATNLIDGTATAADQVYRRDLVTGEIVLASRGLDGAQPNGRSGFSFTASATTDISADGRFVAFWSAASNLVTGDTNRRSDVFVADLSTGISRIVRVNVGRDGVTQSSGEPSGFFTFSGGPRLSADGRVVVFQDQGRELDPQSPGGGTFIARLPDQIAAVATGPGTGGGPHIRVLGARGGGDATREFFAYDGNFTGGVQVAYGDVDGDGAADIVTGAGPGMNPHVRVFSAARHGSDAGAGPHELAGFLAYAPGFRGGVSVAVGDVDGDGVGEIITGAGPNGGPHVRVFRVHTDWSAATATVSEITGFFAYVPWFIGGVRVAAGDIDGDGMDEVLTGAGPGGGAHVEAFKVSAGQPPRLIVSFYAYEPAFRGGVFLAAGDVNGDGRDDIITGAGARGGPHVRVFSVGSNSVQEVASFYAYLSGFTGGVRVAAGDIDSDGRLDVITGAGPGETPHIRAFRIAPSGAATETASFFAYNPAFTGGVFVAGRY